MALGRRGRGRDDGAAEASLEGALAAAQRTGRLPAVVAGDLTLVRPLGWHDVPVVVVTTDRDDVALRSRYVQGHILVPGFLPPHAERTVAILERAGERLHRALGARLPLIYGSDAQLELLYQHRESLEQHYRFLLNDPALAWALADKGDFFSLCHARGVRVPSTVVPKTSETSERLATPARHDSDREIHALPPPLVVKPRRKGDWKSIQLALFESAGKARVFASAADLLSHPAYPTLRDRLIVQHYIDAPTTLLYSFHAFVAEDGAPLGWFCGRKLRTYPAVAGESAYLELSDDPAVEAVGRTVVERLGIRGPLKVDFIRDPRTNTLYTLEVNARFNLWHHLGAANGVNLPLIAYEYLVDGRVPAEPPGYKPRARWVNLYRDLKAFQEDRTLSLARWLGPLLLRPTVYETFAWGDPLPLVADFGRALRGRVARWA